MCVVCQLRLVPGTVESLARMLEWAGISVDEGKQLNFLSIC